MFPPTLFGTLAHALLLVIFGLWIASFVRRRRNPEWGFALWFPFSAISFAAAMLGLLALPTALSPSEDMGGGFAKFGAIVIVGYAAVFAVPLLLSIIFFPRDRRAYRAPSVVLGFAILSAFAFCIFMLLWEQHS